MAPFPHYCGEIEAGGGRTGLRRRAVEESVPQAKLKCDLKPSLPFERCLLPGMTGVQPDVLRDAAQRLKIFGLIIALSSLGIFLFYTVIPALGGPHAGKGFGWIDINIIIAFGVSIGVSLLAHSRRLSPRRLLDVGLLFVVFLAFSAGVIMKLGPGPLPVPAGYGVSEICVLIVLFPIILPSSPWKILVTAALAAAMDPIGIHLALKSGKSLPPGASLYLAYFYNIICIPLALVPTLVMRRLSRQVSEACELGSYQLVECLGKGGMGEVWRAKHSLLARDAAVKLIRPEILGGHDAETRLAMTRRFEREAQATSQMRSAHTIDIYDYGLSAEGICYYVMELLEGLDLESFVRRFGPVCPERAVYFLRQACDSLAEAHENNLIHRDIKPANIYVCRYGREVDFVKVLDFGLVKHSTLEAGGDPALTADNITTGTPAYMAPEQVLGTHPVDGRTDIYALGCVGYWLLTGRIVFKGETAMDTMMHHARTQPPPPSRLTELEIPKSLDAIILSCLEKDPAARPADADLLSARLADSLGDLAWSLEGAKEWWEIHLPRAGSGLRLDPAHDR
jgi:serine/threonine-protein kinase